MPASARPWCTPGISASTRHSRNRLEQRPRQAPQQGFTLLELIIVIVIVGVLVTFATLSIGGRALDDRLEAESKRIEQLLRLAEDEADIKGLVIGVLFSDTGYRFLSLDNSRNWIDYAQGGLLRSRTLLQPFYPELRVEGRLVPTATAEEEAGTGNARSDDSKAEAEAKKVVPQILLLPGGQMTPFTLDLKAPDYASYFRIEGDVLGRVKRERRYLEADQNDRRPKR